MVFKYFGCISHLSISESCQIAYMIFGYVPLVPPPLLHHTHLFPCHQQSTPYSPPHTHTSSPTGCPLFTYRLVHCTIQGTGTCPAHPLSLFLAPPPPSSSSLSLTPSHSLFSSIQQHPPALYSSSTVSNNDQHSIR